MSEDGPSPRDDERKAVTEPSEAEPEEASEEEAEAAASSSSDDEDADAGPALWQRSPKEVSKELLKHGWKWANGSLEYDYHYVRPGARKGRAAVLGAIGDPIEVRQQAEPEDAYVEEVLAQLCDGMVAVFDAHKEAFGWGDKTLELL